MRDFTRVLSPRPTQYCPNDVGNSADYRCKCSSGGPTESTVVTARESVQRMAIGRTIRAFEGRMEKRLPIALIAQLAQAQDGTFAPRLELTFTDNISAHGACVVSSRPWKLGELMDVTSVRDRVTLRGKVEYCQKRSDGCYGIGLRFGEPVAWSTYRTYAGNL